MKEFEQQTCSRCGDPKNAMRDGREVQLRCTCDWKRGFFDRVGTTIHPDFWRKTPERPVPRSVLDWKPKLFSDPSCAFPALMKAQMVAAILRIYEFCHKPIPNGCALQRSIAAGRNLFLRGPHNAGKGLLVSSIKLMAAVKDISVTPLPAEYDVFRADVAQSEGFGADDSKAMVASSYVSPDLMVVENMRAETQIRITGEKTKRKFRAAGAIDDVLARRRAKAGSILISSSDFAGEIADTLGDGLLEVLLSDKTQMLLLFSPAEANAILGGLGRRYRGLSADIAKLRLGDPKKTLHDKYDGKLDMAAVKNALYFAEAFKSIPNDVGGETSTMDIPNTFATNPGKLPPDAVRVFAAFNEARAKKDAAYSDNLRRAHADAVRECEEMSAKMTDKELAEAGKILALATNGEKLEELFKQAMDKRDEMAGAPK